LGASATPDLRGMFLRGAGDDDRPSTVTVELGHEQQDALMEHLHESGTLVTSNSGKHKHKTTLDKEDPYGNEDDGAAHYSPKHSNANDGTAEKVQSSEDGDHSHIITGSTASTGDTEVRPFNYGVNYIIKL
jgi:hypothetical protein